jgi:hypothetical protein
MNAKASNCSVLTLAETAGLRRSLDEKLSGPRGAFWFAALKRLDRKENPWIPSEKVLRVTVPYLTDLGLAEFLVNEQLEGIAGSGISVWDGFRAHVLSCAKTWQVANLEEFVEFDIVSVRVFDLLSADERLDFTYSELLEKASSEYGFEKCDLFDGLVAVKKLVVNDFQLKSRPQKTYIICSDILEDPGDEHSRLPVIHSSSSGFATVGGIKTKKDEGNKVPPHLNSFMDDRVRLLFKSSYM